jgi:hypothetical protein
MEAVTDILADCVQALKDAGGFRRVIRVGELANWLASPNRADLPLAAVFLASDEATGDASNMARIRQTLRLRIGVAVVVAHTRDAELLGDADAAREAAITTLYGRLPPGAQKPLLLAGCQLRDIQPGLVAYEQQFTTEIVRTVAR